MNGKYAYQTKSIWPLATLFLCATFVDPQVAVFAQDELAKNAKPSIVLMFVDNVGYGDLGCYGNLKTKTPNIDRLASQGVRCTDFYIGSPSCMPSRGALLTGRHPVRNGLNEQLWRQDDLEQVGLSRDEWILPRYLKSQGYVSACFGKWNLGFSPGSRPTERGFDEYFGNASGNCDYYTHIYNGRNDLFRGIKSVEVEGYSTDLFGNAACEFIRRHAEDQFFVYVPFNAAHYPNPKNKPPGDPALWQAPDWAFEVYGESPETLDERARYRAVMTALDAGVGKVVQTIDRLGLSQNTIVVLLSDNGAFMIPGRGLECGSNYPLKGGGTTLYEGGIRVPCIVRWPQQISAGSVCGEPLVSMDLVALAISVSGAKPDSYRKLDGLDPMGALSGQQSSPHEFLYFHYGGGSAIRYGRYKLIRPSKGKPWDLYDLQTDIGETKNLASAHLDIVELMRGEFERWYTDAAQ